MKKILFLTVLGATMLASCSQDEALESAAEQRHEISFYSSVGTRAGYSDNIARLSNLKSGGFKVSAFRYAGSGESKTVSTDPHFQNLEVLWNNDAWSNDVRYWPTKGEYVSGTTQAAGLDFLAFYPKSTEGVTFASGVMTVKDYTPVASAASQTDLLTAYTADQTETGASAGVPLAFKHALSQIEVKATNGSDLYNIYVEKVEIHNVHGKETMALGCNNVLSWTATDDAISTRAYSSVEANGSYTLGTTPTSFQKINKKYFMLIPQTTASWKNDTQTANADAGAYFVVYAKIKNKNTGEYALGIGTENTWSKLAIPVPANDGENIKWEAGKKYIYTLQFFKDGGGVGYVPPTPDGETPTGKEGQSAIPGNVHFSVSHNVTEWAE